MKRAAVTVILFGALAALGGCPIYSHEDDGCYRNSDCAPGYRCDDYTGACLASSDPGANFCRAPSDCDQSYTCGKSGRCQPGDCYFNGCVTGFQCQSSTGTWECAPNSSGAAGSSGTDNATQAGTAGVADPAGQGGG